ncbi:hypothetical protein ISCGN_018143 [Ixodes scapularis]
MQLLIKQRMHVDERENDNAMLVSKIKDAQTGKRYQLIYSDYTQCDILRVLDESNGHACELYLHSNAVDGGVPQKCERGRAFARLIRVAGTNINDLPPTELPWDLLDLTQHARPVARNMDTKRHAKRRENYLRQHQAEVTALSQNTEWVIAHTDAALRTSGRSATAAVCPSHDPAGCDPIIVATTNTTLSSLQQVEARAILLAPMVYQLVFE